MCLHDKLDQKMLTLLTILKNQSKLVMNTMNGLMQQNIKF